ncbi:MAG: lipocalin family protein, partial [Rikenellaceae bacterium]
FTLNADGTASSINMSTLVFKTWAFDNGQLLLSGESIGNGVTINFTDTVVWKVAPIDTLNIVSGGYTDSYSRK